MVSSPSQAQTDTTGTVEIYGVGGHANFSLLVDSQRRIKVGSNHRLVLTMQAGEHQIEGKLGSFNPVTAFVVRPGVTTYLVLDFKPPSFGSIMAMHDPNKTMAVTWDNPNAPPDGTYKDEKPEPPEIAAISSLPPFHEQALLQIEKEPADLTEDEVKNAVLQGRHTAVPSTIGVYLEDYQREYGSALSQGQSVSGFSVWVYSARQWIQLQASLAQHDMRPFTASDVTPEMRKRCLHVVANPSTPDHLDGNNMAAASNVSRIVLEVGPSKAVMQPVQLEPTEINLNSALRSASYGGMAASFPEPDIHSPFTIIVIGDSDYRKRFEVKDKHLARLK
jgi:hypothetical protein